MDFKLYYPIAEGVLNHTEDKQPKTWEEVVDIIFTMNSDPQINQLSVFARLFGTSKHPTHFLIDVADVQPFMNNVNLTTGSPTNPYPGFVYAEDKWKITFATYRRLIFKYAEHLIDAFDFVDKIYQMFCLYELEMMGRSRYSTHWAIVEQHEDLIQAMQPHIDWRKKKATAFKPKMDTQPRAFRIVHGSYDSLMRRLDRYRKPGQSKYADDYVSEIYEAVLPSVHDDIQSVIDYVNDTIAEPYLKKQRASSKETHIVTINDRFILINEQVGYSMDALLDVIDRIRKRLKTGSLDASKKYQSEKYALPLSPAAKLGKKTPTMNYTSTEIFLESNGEAFDVYGNVQIGPNKLRDDALRDDVDTLMSATIDNKDLESGFKTPPPVVASNPKTPPRAKNKIKTKKEN